MPALTPAQRQKQIELQRQREAAAKQSGKAKPGQKGAQTGNKGSSSKAGTVGGGKDTKAKPTATKPTDSGRPTSRFAGSREANLERLKNDPRYAATKPSTGGGGTRGGSSSSSSSSKAPTSASSAPATSSRSTPASSSSQAPSSTAKKGGSYGESGKELYNSGKKDNPLMKRMFGYQTGDAPDQQKARNISDQQNGTGKYHGPPSPGKGEPAEPAKPASPNDKPQSGYNPSTKVDGAKYADKKPANNWGKDSGYSPKQSLLEEIRKRRQGR